MSSFRATFGNFEYFLKERTDTWVALAPEVLIEADRSFDTLMFCDFIGVFGASVVRHTDGHLFRTARARVTFSRMSVALAVQMKGLGF